MSKSKTRRLLRREAAYSSAKEKDSNVLHTLAYWRQRAEFFGQLTNKKSLLEAVTARHLGVKSIACRVAGQDDWIHGSFNVCIPVTVTDHKAGPGKRVIIWFPLPYRVGESFRPGNADEKLRCEAGTYVWMQTHCPSVPIPQLYGFELSTGQSFTRLGSLSLLARCFHHLRRLALSALGYPAPSNLVPQRSAAPDLGLGYLVIEYIEKDRGSMLSNTWEERRHEPALRQNLFRGLSQVLLAMARVPVPRIGSFRINDDSTLTLTNRPLTVMIHEAQNEGIPIDIPRDLTYTSVDAYVRDLLGLHDTRLRHQPNAANSKQDCVYQMCALSAMQMISPRVFRRDLHRGPFAFGLTDLHQSNVLIDADWNVTCVIDLEWACARPIEMLHPPRWLTNQAVDEMDAKEYGAVHGEFMDVMEEEEGKLPPLDGGDANGAPTATISSYLRDGWARGTLWYTVALYCPPGFPQVFYSHIHPREKERDKEEYDKRLREAFDDADEGGGTT
ncbi:hypothetical protein BJY00DRAFT_324220 [Aspergillus carlsbadensis]|nr:hypothetical protein BJY00DRAFT_324220 [Aspergillus carlsbadensis]